MTNRNYSTEKQAAAAAAKACAYLAVGVGQMICDGSWMPVVVLRPDQAWMRDRVAERGVVVRVDEVAP